MAVVDFTLPEGAEAFIEDALVETRVRPHMDGGFRIQHVARAACAEFPGLAGWPPGLVEHTVRHLDARVMAGTRRRAAEPRDPALWDLAGDNEINRDLLGE